MYITDSTKLEIGKPYYVINNDVTTLFLWYFRETNTSIIMFDEHGKEHVFNFDWIIDKLEICISETILPWSIDHICNKPNIWHDIYDYSDAPI
jgi:hypothetical protein